MKHFVSHFNDSVKENWASPAITNFGGVTYTYGQLAEQIAKYHILFAEGGIKKGDKIALYARNSAEWVIAYFATLTYDAVSVPFLPDFTPASVAELGAFSECKLLIADDIAYNSLESDEKYIKQLESTPGFAGVINVKDISICVATEKALAVAHDTLDEHFAKLYPNGLSADIVNYYPEERDMEAVVEISFTSGTTSATSKGVVLPARSLSVNLDFARREIPATRGGHIFAILPMAHMFGQTFDVLFPLAGGCHVYIMPGKPTPARLLEGLAKVKPFMFLTVPLVIEKIFKSKVFPVTRKNPAKLLLKIPGLRRIVLNKIKSSLLTAFGNNFSVGVIIGGAFGKIVTSIVNDIIMPPIGWIIGGVDFKDLKIVLKDAVPEKLDEAGNVVQAAAAEVTLNYGAFVQNIIDFLIIAFCVFLLVKGITALSRKKKAKEEEAPAPAAPEPTAEEKLLTEIRDLLKNK